MGWCMTLSVECRVLPEYIAFFKNNYLRDIETCNDLDNCIRVTDLSKAYRDLINIWIDLDIGSRFYEYVFDESTKILRFDISKKVIRHNGYLDDDYRTFVSDIIVPTTSEIMSCNIYDDRSDMTTYLTDNELRMNPFNLPSVVKSVSHKCVDDMIVESTVIYKRSIKKTEEIDLNRCYGCE
jgi:hypothetical protein